MFLTKVIYSCGHEGFVELPDNEKKRASQLKFYETKGSCPDCYALALAARDAQNSIGCSKIKMHDDRYKTEYSDCKFTRVGITEDKYRYVFIPYEKIAADGVLKVLGIKKTDANYSEHYEIAVNNYINRDVSKARKNLVYREDVSDALKERLSKAFDIIEKYQDIISKQ